MAALGGCGASLDGDACADPDGAANAAVVNKRDVTPRNCDGGFFSARTQREVLYAGDDKPRLWTGEAPRTGGEINTASINAPGRVPARPVAAYLGTLRIDYPADDAATAADIAAVQNAGGAKFDPDQRTTINFQKATIDFVLKQLLGGALGVNYIAPEDLGGSITFRTEEPVPKGQILQLVRDLLARNGLEMRDINGVYQIGRPDLINSIETLGAAGRSGDTVTRIVRLRRGNAAEVLGVARQIVPANVALTGTNAPDTILVRGAAADLDGIESVVKSLSAGGLGEDRVALIPLRQSAPDKIATQLNELYHSRGVEGVTVVALEQQHAILVSTRDPSALNGIKRLVRAMDSEQTDEVALRIIPLQHLNADDVAQKLAGLFGGGGGSPSPSGSGGSRSGSNGSRSAGFGSGSSLGSSGLGSSALPNPPLSDLAPNGPRTSLPESPAPTINTPTDGDSSDTGGNSFRGGAFGGLGGVTSGGFGGSSGGGGGGGGGGGAGDPGQTRIVSEKGSNSVMVYSTYAVFKRIEGILRALDVPQAQVVIEATIAEVTLTDQLQHGVQVFLTGKGFAIGSGDVSNPLGSSASTGTSSTGTSSGSTTTTTGDGTVGAGSALATNTGGVITVGANITPHTRVDAVLSALQGITKVKVISSPYLTVANGKEARLVVGDQIPFAERTQSSNNLGNNTTTNEVTVKDTGIVLDITPVIRSNNEVELKISQSVSTPIASSPLGGTLTPVISTRNVDSDVLMSSGHTVLLGGLIQDRIEQAEGGVPILRTTPLIGDFFKSKTDNVSRVELILLLTPRVTRNSSQIENLAHLLQAQVHAR